MLHKKSWFDIFKKLIFPVLFVFLTTNTGKVTASVTLENGFVMLKTRESGTFVGSKEDFNLGMRSDTTQIGTGTNATKSYYAFRGIPYAKPPIGPLRWKDPEAPDITSGPKDATKFKSKCPQWDAVTAQPIGNPDCLYLNIFTPRLHFSIGRGQGQEQSPYDDDPRHAVRLLPVLVYVHSSDYIKNSGDIVHYDQFLEENVLLVTFNFRLGVFGFLSSGDSELPGNYGLLDQIFCLKWIRKNIHRFGGDPNRVTVFGEVSALMMSSLTSDLFQGLILFQSPASIFESPANRLGSRSRDFYNQLLNSTGCSARATQTEILDCLHIKPVEELIGSQTEILKNENFPGIFGPIEQPEVLPEIPSDLERSTTLINGTVPMMIGVDAVEGFGAFFNFYNKHFKNKNVADMDENQLKMYLKNTLSSKFPRISRRAVDEIFQFYFQNSTSIEKTFLKLFGDVDVYNANWDLAQVLSKREAVTFCYLFEHNLDKVEQFLKSGSVDRGHLPWEEEYFLFKNFKTQNQSDSNLDPADLKMSKLLVKILTSFAAYRTPKSAISKEKGFGKWTPLTAESSAYFHLMMEGSKMESVFGQKEAEFWKMVLLKEDPEDFRPVDVPNVHVKPSDTEVSAKSDLAPDGNRESISSEDKPNTNSSSSSSSFHYSFSFFNYLIITSIYVVGRPKL